MHFADVVHIKESDDGGDEGSFGKDEDDDGNGGRGLPQMLPEYRMRLLTGLKQYYKSKYEEGVLGAKVRIASSLSLHCDFL